MTRQWRVTVRYHGATTDVRRSPMLRRAVLDLADMPAFVGMETDGIIYLMAEPVGGLLEQWRKHEKS